MVKLNYKKITINKNYWGVENSPKYINSKYIITDHPSINQKLLILSNYKLIEEKEFEHPIDIFPRVSRTNIYIFQKIIKI